MAASVTPHCFLAIGPASIYRTHREFPRSFRTSLRTRSNRDPFFVIHVSRCVPVPPAVPHAPVDASANVSKAHRPRQRCAIHIHTNVSFFDRCANPLPLFESQPVFSSAPPPQSPPPVVDDYASPDGRPHDPVGPGLHRHGPPADARPLPAQGHGGWPVSGLSQ